MDNKFVTKIIIFILSFILVIAGLFGVIRYVEKSQENAWICVGGQWLKHGQPASPKPIGGCGGS